MALNWNLKNTYTELHPELFSRQKPSPVASPKLEIFNSSLAVELGLDSSSENAVFHAAGDLLILAGNALPPSSDPLAQAYAGHQFGHFNRLGDGRAILLGEHLSASGERWDIQLKGAGPTTYSRRGDGRAALAPMLREYLISEAMHHLGIPTTRSLAVVSTGETVTRDTHLPGAILTRVAKSHLRVGTFQYAAMQSPDILKSLADYAIQRHFPDLASPDLAGAQNPYEEFIKRVCDLQASLIAKWLHVGFIHGVMNTDNVSICGETIDYGPCAFMDVYNPETVFSSIDRQGRYAYGRQPAIAQWNLTRFAESLLVLLSNNPDQAIATAQGALKTFEVRFQEYWIRGMNLKLGLRPDDLGTTELISELFAMMEEHQADYTTTFIELTKGTLKGETLFTHAEFADWYMRLKNRIKDQNISENESLGWMKKANPTIIPRNQLVEEALNSAQDKGDFGPFHRLLQALKNPYDESDEFTDLKQKPSGPNADYKTFCGT